MNRFQFTYWRHWSETEVNLRGAARNDLENLIHDPGPTFGQDDDGPTDDWHCDTRFVTAAYWLWDWETMSFKSFYFPFQIWAAKLLLTEDALRRQLAEWLVFWWLKMNLRKLEKHWENRVKLKRTDEDETPQPPWAGGCSTWKPGILWNFQWRSFCPFFMRELRMLIFDLRQTEDKFICGSRKSSDGAGPREPPITQSTPSVQPSYIEHGTWTWIWKDPDLKTCDTGWVTRSQMIYSWKEFIL